MFFGMPEDHLQVLVSAKAIIWNGGRVLLARNSRLEWDLPGGKVKLGETIESALRRELQEELAVELVSQELISAAMHHFYSTILVLIYGCVVTNLENIQISEEHSEVNWFELDKLPTANIPLPYIEPLKIWSNKVKT
ncbi:MAG: 8-oxo-dGTP diphosphatase [Patiriisocius sp.]|jgi:8-oxo-dGTP diphosphatase